MRHALRSVTIALLASLAIPLAGQEPTFKVLHSFTGSADGAMPFASLIKDKEGNLYGTANAGGNLSGCSTLIPPGCGVVFKLDTSGNETVLYSFAGPPDGANPIAGLVMDESGNLYGTTVAGGDSFACFGGCGVVFKLDREGRETVLHSFTGGTDGGEPSGLIRNTQGNLYGTALFGGNFSGECPAFGGCGVVFKLDSSGAFTVLYSFRGGTDGAGPRGVIRDRAGSLYGTTSFGGAFSEGTVFKLDSDFEETVLYSFTGLLDGGSPMAGLVRDASGHLYGTTEGGGFLDCFGAGCGVVFELDPDGKETVLYRFSGPDGALPESAGVVRDRAGNLYGVTYIGGVASSTCPIGCGVVFKLDSTGKETVLYSFKGGTDGLDPAATLLLDRSGNLYGTALFGGASPFGWGTVFELTPCDDDPADTESCKDERATDARATSQGSNIAPY